MNIYFKDKWNLWPLPQNFGALDSENEQGQMVLTGRPSGWRRRECRASRSMLVALADELGCFFKLQVYQTEAGIKDLGTVVILQDARIDDNDAFLFILLGLVILISNGMLVPLNFSHVACPTPVG